MVTHNDIQSRDVSFILDTIGNVLRERPQHKTDIDSYGWSVSRRKTLCGEVDDPGSDGHVDA